MIRQGVWGWPHGVRVLSVVFLVLIFVGPVVAPVHAGSSVDEARHSAGAFLALPNWWLGSAVSGPGRSVGAPSSKALPAWWHQHGPAALRSAPRMQAAVTGMAIHGPRGTAVISKTLRTDEPYTFFAVVTETTGQTDTREAIWTLSPETAIFGNSSIVELLEIFISFVQPVGNSRFPDKITEDDIELENNILIPI